MFDTATVSCKSGQTVILVCSPAGRWQFTQPTECQPQAAIGGAGSRVGSSFSLIVLSYLLVVMRLVSDTDEFLWSSVQCSLVFMNDCILKQFFRKYRAVRTENL